MLRSIASLESIDEAHILPLLLEQLHDPHRDLSEALCIGLGVMVAEGILDTAKTRHEVMGEFTLSRCCEIGSKSRERLEP